MILNFLQLRLLNSMKKSEYDFQTLGKEVLRNTTIALKLGIFIIVLFLTVVHISISNLSAYISIVIIILMYIEPLLKTLT